MKIGVKCSPSDLPNPCGTGNCNLSCYDVTDSGNYKCTFALEGDLINRNNKCEPSKDKLWWLDETCKEAGDEKNKYKCQYSNGDWKCKCGGPNEPCCQGKTPGSNPFMSTTSTEGTQTRMVPQCIDGFVCTRANKKLSDAFGGNEYYRYVCQNRGAFRKYGNKCNDAGARCRFGLYCKWGAASQEFKDDVNYSATGLGSLGLETLTKLPGQMVDLVKDGISMFDGGKVQEGACRCGDVKGKVCCPDRSKKCNATIAKNLGLNQHVPLFLCNNGMTCNEDGFCEGTCDNPTECTSEYKQEETEVEETTTDTTTTATTGTDTTNTATNETDNTATATNE